LLEKGAHTGDHLMDVGQLAIGDWYGWHRVKTLSTPLKCHILQVALWWHGSTHSSSQVLKFVSD
jgi:hypothetical protein